MIRHCEFQLSLEVWFLLVRESEIGNNIYIVASMGRIQPARVPSGMGRSGIARAGGMPSA